MDLDSQCSYQAIGFFHCSAKQRFEAPRQGVLAGQQEGELRLQSHFSQEALEDLHLFDKIWLVYDFHLNKTWKNKVRPPRGSDIKRGVFATRSPYRPNSIGISCVTLERIEGRSLFLRDFDLLDGTPVLDIKPYLVYSDSFPRASKGWLNDLPEVPVEFASQITEPLSWLEKALNKPLRETLVHQLQSQPTSNAAKRVKPLGSDYVFAFRTWRFYFSFCEEKVEVFALGSGYSVADLHDDEDPYNDKEIHREFFNVFGGQNGIRTL